MIRLLGALAVAVAVAIATAVGISVGYRLRVHDELSGGWPTRPDPSLEAWTR